MTMPIASCQQIVNAVSGKTVSSFSELNQALGEIPGIQSIAINDPIITVLATLFDSSELADGSLDLPRQTPAQSITLETHFFPSKLCIGKLGTVDYSVGFKLGDKYAEVAHGMFNDLVANAT